MTTKLDSLFKIINNSKDENEVWNAALEIGDNGHINGLPILINLLKTTNSNKIRNAAALVP